MNTTSRRTPSASPFEQATQPRGFEKFVNPEVGQMTRRLGLDKTFVWGQGSYLRDEQGTEYLDFLSAYGALPFGHSPAPILKVLASFQDTCEPIFVQPSAPGAAAQLAQRLLEIAPGEYRSVTFQNSGAEAVEAALKACIAATGRRRILSTRRSFHGKTLGALSATGSDNYQHLFHAPHDGFDFVDFADAQALRDALAQRPEDYAAVILEPIQAEGGVHVPPASYLAAVRAACDEFGVLMIVDEVQTGLGRTGVLFALEREGVQADCLVLAKALGGGAMPVGACLLGPRATSAGFHLKHSSTFGGNALACRVGLQVLDLLTQQDSRLQADVQRHGRHLLASLRALAARHPGLVREVRGEGYLIGVEFEVDRSRFEPYFGAFLGIFGEQETLVPLVASYLLNVERVRVAPTLNGANTLRVEPPLTATREQCDFFLAAFERTLVLLASGNTGAFLAHLVAGDADQRSGAPGPRLALREPDLGMDRFGFLLHPLEPRNYAEFDESLAAYSDASLSLLESRLGELMSPFHVSTLCLQSQHTGRVVEGDFIMIPRSARQLSEMPVAEATGLIEHGIQIAVERGARLIGLGGHTSIVTRGGLRVAGLGVPVTSGNTYTTLTAVEASAVAVAETGRAIRDLNVVVIGATGSIGSAIARLLASQARALTLVGNPRRAQLNWARFAAVIRKLVDYAGINPTFEHESIISQLAGRLAQGEPSAALVDRLMQDNGREVRLVHTTDTAAALVDADLVLVSTNSTERFIQPDLLKPGAIVCDVSRPANVSLDIADSRPDVLVIDGGIVQAPGRPNLGSRFGIPEDLAYACMAETMLLALGGVFRDTSLGLDLSNEDLLLLQRLSTEHGFRIAGLRSFDKPLEASRLAAFLQARETEQAA